MMTSEKTTHFQTDTGQLVCSGEWVLATLPELKTILERIIPRAARDITFDGQAIDKMDSAGAWLLTEWRIKLEKQGIKVKLEKFSKNYQTLLSMVSDQLKTDSIIRPPIIPDWLARVGMRTLDQLTELRAYLAFIGHLTFEVKRILRSPAHFRIQPILGSIYKTGFQALPIIALLSFMIGVVITYQMGLQLQNYGANIYIVDLLGLSILREFGPLITAIMVAGRTGSAFTAQLGMMKINQEVDALDTMGVTPAELLLLPRIAGLFIALPLLTMWADIFGVLGGMIMANDMLHITWHDFLQRFPHVISLRALMIGLGKAPVFALIIASIGCFEGMQVSGSADSVGRNTTRSVVLSIFFIIVADAIFSIIFSKMKL